MKFTRIVLKPQARWRDVHSAAEDARDWRVTEFSPVKQEEPYIKWWKTIDERCVIVYVQDPLREVRCYHLSGATRKSNATHIRRRVPTYDQAEIEALMAAARSAAEKVAAVYTAAASAPPERDPAIFDSLTRSLTDPEPAVRRAAVDAALLALWPDLREPLEQVAAADADAGLRAFAGETLQTLQSRVWSAAPRAFDFVPLPPDPRRITPLTGVRDDWHEAAFGKLPAPPVPPAPSRKPAFRLAEKLIVAGLTGRTPPAVPGDHFAFVAYDPDGEPQVEVLGEGPTPFVALMAGVRRLAAADDEGDNAQFFGTLPEAVRTSGDRALIGFLQRVAEGNGLSYGTESVYLDDGVAAVRPGARCVFAWDAEPPTQEEAYGLYAVPADRPKATGRKSRR